jgi:transposase
MQGLHVFDPRAVVAVDLESLVHQDHFLRKVERILETSFIRELTAACYASGVGRPSIDPEVFFRMLLVAYLYDISRTVNCAKTSITTLPIAGSVGFR